MIVLSWNCRGLGHPRAIPVLRELKRTHKPDIIILIETLVHGNKLEEIRVKLGFDNVFSVDRVGRSGGLRVLWQENINCSINNYSRNHIDMHIEDVCKGKWRLTGIYGFPERDRRRASWDFLRTLHTQSNLPWLCIGYFNDMLSNDEKRGRVEHPAWCISGFREAVTDCALHDLPMEGYPFTWVKSKGTAEMIEEKFDRALVSSYWLTKFLQANLENVIAPISDHTPIRLNTEAPFEYNHKKEFRFENRWVEEPDFKEVVMHTWRTSAAQDVTTKLTECAQTLKRWSRSKHTNFRNDIKECQMKIAILREKNDPQSAEHYANEKKQLLALLMNEESYWKQRAKCHWLKEGDSNTRFFHAYASSRRRKNRIERIQDESGEWIEEDIKIGSDSKLFDQSIFSRYSRL